MINWKYSILGAVLVVVFGMVLLLVEYGTFLAIFTWFIPGVIVGYLVNNVYKNGVINGFIAGLIGGFILGILQITFYSIQTPLFNRGLWFILLFAFSAAGFFAILAAVGGIIGFLIRDKI